jgi:pyridoxine kinase
MSEGILSIQSHVAYGHVGNSAATFPLQRLGLEVWPVNTVLFSNHTGYGEWRGHAVTVEQVREILKGVEERGAFARTRAVMTGYLGSPELGEAVLEAVAAIRAARPGAIYACDPVMGDEGRGFFVRPGIPELFRDRILPTADIVTPNQFELAWLSGQPIEGTGDAIAAAARIRRQGPTIVVATSVLDPARPDQLAIVADSAAESWAVWTPRLDVSLNGTGDAFTALFLGYWLRSGALRSTLEAAAAAMFALVEATCHAGSRELLLVEAQDQLVAPARRFEAERLR